MFAGLVAAADDKAEMPVLYAALNALNQEQQAVFQQFQMLQELRRANDRAFYSNQFPTSRQNMEVPNYTDLIQSQRELNRRSEDLTQQSDQLYARFSELAVAKAQLMQRIFGMIPPQ
jgi:hypothetical protein